MKDTIMKSNKLIDKNPAAITKTLYGRGVKLEINNINIPCAMKSDWTVSNDSWYPNLTIYGKISSKRKTPKAYPTRPPTTDEIVVIMDKYFHWFGNLRDIGINKTSTGIGKKIDSINEYIKSIYNEFLLLENEFIAWYIFFSNISKKLIRSYD